MFYINSILLPERHCGYTLRPRIHELCLINKSRLDEQNFMYRLLFKDMYTELKCNKPNFIFYFISFIFVVIDIHCVLCITAY